MKPCVFCKIASHEIESADIYYEDDQVLVMLDVDWAVKGHSLVIWKKHHLNASDLSETEYLKFSAVFRKAEKALLSATKKERALTLKTGGLVSHFHFHIYPVDLDTNWQTIKDIFEKKTIYQPKSNEAATFVATLKNMLAQTL